MDSTEGAPHLEKILKTQGASTGGITGMEYQLDVIIWNLLKGKAVYGTNFELTTELKEAEKFDDVVFKFPDDGKFRLIQVKHSSGKNTELSFSHLLYDNTKPYNLQLYYDSYKKIAASARFKGKIRDMVFFTNWSLSQDVLDFTQELPVKDTIFDFEKKKDNKQQPKLLKFKDDFFQHYLMCQELKEIAIKFVRAYLENEIIDFGIFKQYGDTFQKEVFDLDAPQVCFRSNFINVSEKSTLSTESKFFQGIVAHIQSNKKPGFNKSLANIVAEGKHKLSINKSEHAYANNAKDNPIAQSLKDFFEHLILAVNQPNKTELRECNLNELIKQYGMTVSLSEFASVTLMANVRKWYDDEYCSFKDGRFLEEFEVFEDEFRLLYHTLEFCKTFANYKIEFQHNERVTMIESIVKRFLNAEKTPFQLLKTNSGSGIIVNSIIVHQYLKKAYQKQFLFVNLEKYSESLDHLLQLFKKCKSYDLLILSMDGNFQLKPDLERGLQDDKETKKKIIIIGNGNSNSDLIDITSIATLSTDTQNFMLQKNINFQGHKMKFNEIVARKELIECKIKDECLLGLTCKMQDITIGSKVSAAIKYYVNRTVEIVLSDRQQTESTQINDKDLSKFIYDSTDSVVVISDIPGIGKTTVSSKLAEEFKKNYVTFWVSKFNLSKPEYVTSFRNLTSKDTEKGFKDFIFEKLLKLSTEMERFIFNQYLEHGVPKSKFVFIFDGFDEIPTKCQNNVIRIIQYLQTKAKVQFILVTTRPSMNEKLVTEFHPTNIFKLQPLNADNKTKFLVNYWARKDGDADENRLQKFAHTLVQNMSRPQLNSKFDFTGIPLHLQMLGDIYEKEAIEFAQSAKDLSQESFSIGIYNLYEKFFKIKENLYIERNSSRVEDFVEQLRPKHRQLALKLLKLEDSPNDSNGNDETNVLEAAIAIGFVQKNAKGQYYIIHRTYGEFLLAEHVVVGEATAEELMCLLKLPPTSMARAFLNDKIQLGQIIEIKHLDTVESLFFKDYIKRSIKENTLSLLEMMLTTFNNSKPDILMASLLNLGNVEWKKESYCLVMKWIKCNITDESESFKILSVLFQRFWGVYTLQEAYEDILQEVRHFLGEVGIPEDDLFRLLTSEDVQVLDYFKPNENYFPAIQFQLKYFEENLNEVTKDAESKDALNKFISKLLAVSVEDSDEEFVCNWIQALGDSMPIADILKIPDDCHLDSIQYYTVWGRKHILRILLKAGEDYDAVRVVQSIYIFDIPSERNAYLENCRLKAVRDGNTLLIDSMMTKIKNSKMFKAQFTIDPGQTTTNDFLISLLNLVWDRYSEFLIEFLLVNKAFYFGFDAADGETVCDELNNRVIEIIEDTRINSNDILRLLKKQFRRNKKTILHQLAYSNNVHLFKRLLDCIEAKVTKDGSFKLERLQSVLSLKDFAKESHTDTVTERTVAEIIDLYGCKGMREAWSEFEAFLN